jgi:peptidoglycan/LPS O-acetylase OafA/YrhL
MRVWVGMRLLQRDEEKEGSVLPFSLSRGKSAGLSPDILRTQVCMDPGTSTEDSGEAGTKRQRILFFDALRILCIALIVLGHYQFPFSPGINGLLFMDGYLPYGIYPLGVNLLAVFGMIFVSGAVMEYNHEKIDGFSAYGKFIFRRFIRLYPAYWMSLILAIMLPPWIYRGGPMGMVIEFTGFFFLLGQGAGYLNNMGWFIGTIFCLYLLFPFLSGMVRRYRLRALLLLMLVSYLSRFLLLTYDPDSSSDLLFRWLPLANLFEFCLGIYLVQNALYPKAITSPLVRRVSEYTFYVFLFHNVVISLFIYDVSTNGGIINLYLQSIANLTGDFFLIYTLWFVIIMGSVLVVSWCAMLIDGRVHEAILGNARVRRFLQG